MVSLAQTRPQEAPRRTPFSAQHVMDAGSTSGPRALIPGLWGNDWRWGVRTELAPQNPSTTVNCEEVVRKRYKGNKWLLDYRRFTGNSDIVWPCCVTTAANQNRTSLFNRLPHGTDTSVSEEGSWIIWEWEEEVEGQETSGVFLLMAQVVV